MGQDEIYLGVAVAARVLYLGCVRAPDELLLDDDAERIEPSSQLELDARLGDVRDRVRQDAAIAPSWRAAQAAKASSRSKRRRLRVCPGARRAPSMSAWA